jgi:3-deoxy-D-manno-octulosonic-acid transferase
LPVFFYNILLSLYQAGIGVASLWNPKAKKWLRGRRGLFDNIRLSLAGKSSKIIWFHCSSLGEFEQGRPVMEKIRAAFPGYKLLITFFSPSGYEVRKNYSGADYVFYLPIDSRNNAAEFLDLVNPSLAVFIKYEYWYYYLIEIKKRKINCLLVSAIFRKGQSFFKSHGSLQRRMLHCFTQIFVQNKESKELLDTIDIRSVIVSGDTRFDSVIQVVEKFDPIPLIEKFVNNGKCIVAGSTWNADEEALQKALRGLGEIKLIIAPHEIHESHLADLKKLFPRSIRFSDLGTAAEHIKDNILIIDNIGMLSRLYKYAFIAYVGGGFTRDGVHNVLEAAVYGKPVVFGKNYKKYREAADLVEYNGAISFSNPGELFQLFTALLNDEDGYSQVCQASMNYVWKNKGATEKILDYIVENRLLTS